MDTRKAITYNTVTVAMPDEFVSVSESNGITVSALGTYRDLETAFSEILEKHQLSPKLREDLIDFQKIAKDADWDFAATRKAIMRLELDEDEVEPKSEE